MENERSGTTSFVDTDEVKSNLAVLLERVESGEEIIITVLGQPVAKLIRPEASNPSSDRVDAIRTIQEIASRNRLDGLSIKDLIGIGRK